MQHFSCTDLDEYVRIYFWSLDHQNEDKVDSNCYPNIDTCWIGVKHYVGSPYSLGCLLLIYIPRKKRERAGCATHVWQAALPVARLQVEAAPTTCLSSSSSYSLSSCSSSCLQQQSPPADQLRFYSPELIPELLLTKKREIGKGCKAQLTDLDHNSDSQPKFDHNKHLLLLS